MTEAAKKVLEAMRGGSELAYENGIAYLGNSRVKGARKILTELLRAMAIRRVESGGCSTEYYRAAPVSATQEPGESAGSLSDPVAPAELPGQEPRK